MVRCPPFICIGPSESGKSVICRALLNSVPYLSIDVNCEGFSSTQQFILTIWGKLKALIPSRKYLNGLKSLSSPTKFTSLVDTLSEVIKAINDFQLSTSEPNPNLDKPFVYTTALCIYFDRIDRLATLPGEPNILFKLLSIPTVSMTDTCYFTY